MNPCLRSIFGALVLGNLTTFGAPDMPGQLPPLPDGTQSSYDVEQAPVLKVFSATEGDNRFVAYLVKWKEFEVVVSDPLAHSAFQVGDRISFMAQKIRIGQSVPQVSALNFTLQQTTKPKIDGTEGVSPGEQDRQQRLVHGELEAAKNETERFYALNRAAKQALSAGQTEEARKLATELERLAPKHRQNWNYGNAVQDANQVLGRIALAEGDVETAKQRLLASADSDGSPQMNSFGPNMQLAKDFLARGEKDVVLEYFDRCGKFWKMGTDQLAAWTEAVRNGKTPNFGANLVY